MFPSNDVYFNKSIIKPKTEIKQEEYEKNQRITRMVIDSRIRDKTLFPNPNSYEIKLDDDINDVVSCKLICMDVPFSTYLINNIHRNINLKIGSTKYVATLTIGDYTKTALATEIQNSMNSAVGSAVFTVTYNTLLDNYRFQGISSFTLDFTNTPGMASLLGFNTISYDSSSNIIISPYRMNMDYNSYIIMDIDQFDTIKSIDRDLNKSFAILPKQYNNLNISDKYKITKYFNPIIPKLMKIRVNMYDKYGNPYDFAGLDHRFELSLTSFKQGRKYT